MSYMRLLRLPPQSETAGFTRSWKRHLSACGGGSKNVRRAWADSHAVNPLPYLRSRLGDSSGLGNYGGATLRVVGSRCVEESCIARGGPPMESIGATRKKSAALSELQRCLESNQSQHSSTRSVLRATLGASLRSKGALLGGCGPWAGGATTQQRVHWQSLRALSSGPPEQADSKTEDSPDGNGRRGLPAQKVFMGGLLKPSDVSEAGGMFRCPVFGHCVTPEDGDAMVNILHALAHTVLMRAIDASRDDSNDFRGVLDCRKIQHQS